MARRSSWIRSPDNPEAFVQVEGFVRRHDWDVLHKGLRNDLAVEGICISTPRQRVRLGECELCSGTAISVRETTLISRTAFDFRGADIAARQRRSGVLTAQMNVTVSRMSRMR